MSLEITVQDAATSPQLPSTAQFELWVNTALAHVKNAPQEGEITIKIIDELESARLNHTFRKKEGPTNILSFSYDSTTFFFVGDLAICAALVEREAQEQEKQRLAHWAHLTVHGTLHLMGYDHIEEHEAVIMESLEAKILQKLGYDSPY